MLIFYVDVNKIALNNMKTWKTKNQLICKYKKVDCCLLKKTLKVWVVHKPTDTRH